MGRGLAALALATLASLSLSWEHHSFGWSSALGVAIGLLATALLVAEGLPVLQLGAERALLGGALAVALAATIGILLGFALARVDFYGGAGVSNGSWVGTVLAVLLALSGAARLAPQRGDRPDAHWLDALFLAGGAIAFASTFMSWVVASNHLGGPKIDGWSGAGVPAALFALAALAVTGAELFRLGGLQPSAGRTLAPVTIVLAAGLAAIFGVLSVIDVARQLAAHTTLGHGPWLALAASAALVIGATSRLGQLHRTDV